MSSSRENHDDALFEILKECRTLPNFLDDIFGFLQRRTDFYHVAKDANAAVGLPKGLAEKLSRHTFYKWKPKPSETIYQESDIPACSAEEVISDDTDEPVTLKELSIEDNNHDLTFTESESYNGGAFESYCWSQTITDVDIIVKVPQNVTKKDIDVEILPNSVSVKLADAKYLIRGELCQKCKANEAIWSLERCKLQIHLDKCQEMWWNCLVKSEPPLDISKIDCTRSYEDLPEEAQAKIEELQWNQERKRLGLPTSEELVLQEKLKKAWNAEGSPFSGPFEPSSVSFS